MAKPIKETPILKGKDATRFLSRMKEVESKKPMHPEKKKRILDNYNSFNALFKKV